VEIILEMDQMESKIDLSLLHKEQIVVELLEAKSIVLTSITQLLIIKRGSKEMLAVTQQITMIILKKNKATRKLSLTRL
jgi:hypothetical protein